MKPKKFLMILGLYILGADLSLCQNSSQYAPLGDFQLDNGTVINNCVIEYRTFGELNPAKSNAILYPTWFSGTTEHLTGLIGSGKLVDSSKYYVIAMGALGNGVSSSPSNSALQPGLEFPVFTIGDMVRSQYEVVTQVLGLSHLYGIIGGSMGGMQVFEWITSYPDFMDKAISYVGSPRFVSYDLLQCQAMMQAIETGWECGNTDTEIARNVALIQNLITQTPSHRVRNVSREDFPTYITDYTENFTKKFNSLNWYRQLQALVNHDVSLAFDSSIEETAAVVRADVLIIVAAQDHIVNPGPALEFAQLIKAETIVFDNDCGHLAPSCEMERFVEIINSFFEN